MLFTTPLNAFQLKETELKHSRMTMTMTCMTEKPQGKTAMCKHRIKNQCVVYVQMTVNNALTTCGKSMRCLCVNNAFKTLGGQLV